MDTPVNSAILQRVAQRLQDNLEAIPGTDKVEVYGESEEEIQVNIDQLAAARLGLTAQTISQQIQASDAKLSAGEL